MRGIKHVLGCLVTLLSLSNATGQSKVVKTYPVKRAHQAVAVDADHFYVINNRSITKHQKDDGTLVKSWEDQDSVLVHLNSGIVLDGRLYSCHSNYPDAPMASSIEVFDPETLTPVASHSLGIRYGSATWIDRYQGHWYVAFAHYTGQGGEPGKDNRWTQLVKFTDDWQAVAAWVFPKKLIKRFQTRSNSGGVILNDGRLLVTGHDAPEVYVLALPDQGYTLRWISTVPVGSFGQGIAYEEEGDQAYIYGIDRDNNQVIVTELSW